MLVIFPLLFLLNMQTISWILMQSSSWREMMREKVLTCQSWFNKRVVNKTLNTGNKQLIASESSLVNLRRIKCILSDNGKSLLVVFYIVKLASHGHRCICAVIWLQSCSLLSKCPSYLGINMHTVFLNDAFWIRIGLREDVLMEMCSSQSEAEMSCRCCETWSQKFVSLLLNP